MAEKDVLVAWSGGLDSTALVIDYLNKGYTVSLQPIVITCNHYKNIREKKARELIYESYLRHHKVRLLPAVKIDSNISPYLIFSQVPCWLFALLISQERIFQEVAIGYVQNDDAVSFLDDIQKIWKSFKTIAPHLPKLVFPLVKTPKYQLYNTFPHELKTKITWCESPDPDDHCGKCPPCKRMLRLVEDNKIELVTIDSVPNKYTEDLK